ncbi:MAG TPA: hypothetical protein VFV50_08730 [Bdellovibrionales bacterium]|nr:hypothetical protein [Bdellovibrionales bacterium]
MAQQRAWFAEHGKFNLNLNDPLLQFDSNPEDRPKNFMIGFPRSCYRGVADWRANSVLPKASDTDLDGEALLALESRFADLGPCPELTKLESLAIWAIGDFYEGPPFHVYKGRVEGGYQELETDRKSQPTTAEVWGKITSAIAVAAGFWLLFFPPVGVRRTVIFAQNGVILVAAFAVFLGYLKFFKLFWM